MTTVTLAADAPRAIEIMIRVSSQISFNDSISKPSLSASGLKENDTSAGSGRKVVVMMVLVTVMVMVIVIMNKRS
jgi:hypothetical protein